VRFFRKNPGALVQNDILEPGGKRPGLLYRSGLTNMSHQTPDEIYAGGADKFVDYSLR
jgi:hypothetical protein